MKIFSKTFRTKNFVRKFCKDASKMKNETKVVRKNFKKSL
jgi:hypothetical protein